jgi:hypothetical protein
MVTIAATQYCGNTTQQVADRVEERTKEDSSGPLRFTGDGELGQGREATRNQAETLGV